MLRRGELPIAPWIDTLVAIWAASFRLVFETRSSYSSFCCLKHTAPGHCSQRWQVGRTCKPSARLALLQPIIALPQRERWQEGSRLRQSGASATGTATQVAGNAAQIASSATQVAGNATQVAGNAAQIASDATQIAGRAI